MYKKFYFLLFIVLLAGFSVSFAQNTAKETTFYTIERYVCSAELSGLEANTKYIYKIVSEGVESKVHSFVTAGKKGKWNFVAFTDFQHKGNNETLPLIKSMKELAQPPLVICSGDMVDVAGKILDIKSNKLCCGANIEVSSQRMKVTVYNQRKEPLDTFIINAKR